jgi:hypothetical protein
MKNGKDEPAVYACIVNPHFFVQNRGKRLPATTPTKHTYLAFTKQTEVLAKLAAIGGWR